MKLAIRRFRKMKLYADNTVERMKPGGDNNESDKTKTI